MSEVYGFVPAINWVIDTERLGVCSNGQATFVVNRVMKTYSIVIDGKTMYNDAYKEEKFYRYYTDTNLKKTLDNLYNM